MRNNRLILFLTIIVITLFSCPAAQAAGLSLQLDGSQGASTGVQLFILLTILSVAPAIFLMTTGFVRIIIVLSMLRQAMGIGQLPPNQVLVGLALILTFVVMQPTFSAINKDALQPFIHQQVSQEVFFQRSSEALKTFMLKQTKEKDLAMTLKIASLDKPKNQEEIPLYIVIAAFIISELTLAFQIGFTIFLPFIIIDLIVASSLVSIGLMFLPPTTISLPIKAILFVLIDGWNILSEALVYSFIK